MPSFRVPQLAALAVGVVAGVAACGGDDAPATTTATAVTTATPTPPAVPAICGALRARVTGRISAPDATELSGLALSPTQRGVLWAHNDSGDAPRLFALRTDGSLIATIPVPGAEAVDWEDMANGPDRALLIADIGDNAAARDSVTVYRVPEPALADRPTQTGAAVALRFTYPDGPHDAETLLADRRTGEIVIVAKRFSGRSGVYAGTATGAGGTLRHVGDVDLGLGGLATAGDVSADGHTIAIRTYTSVYAWRRPKATMSLAKAITTNTPCRGRASLGSEGQGEALALARDGRSFFTVPEGAGAPLRRYTPRKP